MKHVFVETNFLVELLRPSPSRDATNLFARNGVDLRLYVPWCSQSEVWRTLSDRVIREDLGFTDAMMKFAVRRWLADRTLFDKREIDKLRELDGDLASKHPSLAAEYAACGLTVRQDLQVT